MLSIRWSLKTFVSSKPLVKRLIKNKAIGFAVWFLWVEAAPIALFLISFFTSHLPDTNALKIHLIESAPYFRFLIIGISLLVIMRYRPQGILPEKIIKQ